MRRTITRPSTASCNLAMYMGFLLSEPKRTTCVRLCEIMRISHDSVNRFLLREFFEPKDLFDKSKSYLNLEGGTLSVDDCVLDKIYSRKMDLVSHFWSGKHHRVVRGINLITLYYTDLQGKHLPVNYRVYDKKERKTKNEYFLEMVNEVLEWGLSPAFITGDSWYSSVGNLKAVKEYSLGSLFALESNRLVSLENSKWEQVQKLDIPEDGVIVWLRGVGQVRLFRKRLKDELRHYVVYLPDAVQLTTFGRDAFTYRHDQHWKIEQYHRAIKQLCNIERFQVRKRVAILNHLFAALCGYVHLQALCALDVMSNCYQIRPNLFREAIAFFIRLFVSDNNHLLQPHFFQSVNA